MTSADTELRRRHPLWRPRWLVLRWVGLRWQRRLGWLGVLLLGAGPILAALVVCWYVRSGALRSRLEQGLSQALSGQASIEGLGVIGWKQYGLARMTWSGGGSSELRLSAEDGLLRTGESWELSFSRATLRLSEQLRLSRWARVLRPPEGAKPVHLLAGAVRLEGAPEPLGDRRLSLRGELTLSDRRRQAFLLGRTPTGERFRLLASDTPAGSSLLVSPRPLLVGSERVSSLVGWPIMLLPSDLTGELTMSEDAGGPRAHLEGQGSLDVGDVARQVHSPEASGLVELTINLQRSLAVGSDWTEGTVVVRSGEEPVHVDGLALELFWFVLTGELFREPVEGEPVSVDQVTLQARLAGGKITIGGDDDAVILRARSGEERELRLAGPVESDLEEVVDRFRLARRWLGAGR